MFVKAQEKAELMHLCALAQPGRFDPAPSERGKEMLAEYSQHSGLGRGGQGRGAVGGPVLAECDQPLVCRLKPNT